MKFREVVCPHCGSKKIRRSARHNQMERLLGALLLPYRCETCNERCFKARSLVVQPAGKKTPDS